MRRILALLPLAVAWPAFGQRPARPAVEGYADRLSYRPGETVSLHVSSSAPTFSVEIAREGAKREVVWTKEGVPGSDCEWYERWVKGRTGAAVLGTYSRPGGGTVVTVGSTDWAHGLRGRDPVVERVTRNVLDRLSK